MTDLKVGIFTQMFSEVNGTAKASRTLSFALAKQGVEVHVIAPHCKFFDIGNANIHLHNLRSIRLLTDPEVYFTFPLFKYFRARIIASSTDFNREWNRVYRRS